MHCTLLARTVTLQYIGEKQVLFPCSLQEQLKWPEHHGRSPPKKLLSASWFRFSHSRAFCAFNVRILDREDPNLFLHSCSFDSFGPLLDSRVYQMSRKQCTTHCQQGHSHYFEEAAILCPTRTAAVSEPWKYYSSKVAQRFLVRHQFCFSHSRAFCAFNVRITD